MCWSGLEGCAALRRDDGHGLRRFSVETKFAKGALLVEEMA